MMDKLMKLKEAKGSSMRPVEKDAKSAVLKDILAEATKEMSNGLHGLKKVTVAAPDKAGLHAGLKQAGKIVDQEAALQPSRDARLAGGDDIGQDGAQEMPAEGSPEEEADESAPFEAAEQHAMHQHSPEELAMHPHEIDAKIQALTHLKHKKLSHKGA